MDSLLITICVRGGSKGIPNKNIKMLGGNPLVYYTLKVANIVKEKLSDENNVDIVLSTDSEKIKETVKKQSLYIETEYNRPIELATDSSGKLDAIVDVKNYMENKKNKKYDFVLDMDATSPLRTVEDILNAFKLLKKDKKSLDIFSVSPANRNPYFNMVEENDLGYYTLCKSGKFLTRQSAPKVYDMNASFYIYKKEFFELKLSDVITDNTLIYEMKHLCFDLDHPIDFEFMEYLIANNKLDFKFEK